MSVALKYNRGAAVAAFALCVGINLGVSGALSQSGPGAGAVEPGPRMIRAVVSSGTNVSTDDRVRVLVRSFELAALSAELNAKILHLPAREGDRFRKGDIIVRFDCARTDAEHAAATAAYNAHRVAYESQYRLLKYQAASTLAVEQARFEMEKAMADVRGLEVRQANCVIHAPFDGRVVEKMAQVHEIAQPNQPIIRVVNEAKLELVVMVPSTWLARITEGKTFLVKLDETGETHEARIVQSTGLIDPVSQSGRFIAELVSPSATVTPGMSGTAQLFRREAR